MAIFLVNIVALLVSLHHRMSVVLNYWESMSMTASNISQSLWQAMKEIKSQIGFMLFIISWINLMVRLLYFMHRI